ncbi:hypothetical protein BJV78DRAFT_1231396 [Lactifluus subvellereus]|nr:hypothetical protein BJV78DRAFT_1231396 [Lactifluus subvellereus]
MLCVHAPALIDKRQPPFLVIDNLEHAMPDPGDDADAPIIVPRPGQILRRAARTKIRKHGQTGEGAHRFNARRRGAGSNRDTPSPVPEPRTSSDLSTSDHSDAEPPQRQRLLSNESLGEVLYPVRPESYSAESFIFDAYARDDVKESEIKVVSPPSSLRPLPRRSLSPPPPPMSREEPEPIPPLPAMQPIRPALALPPLQHPLPQRASSLVSQSSVETPPSRTPSPVAAVHSDLSSHTRPEPRPVQTYSTAPPSAPPVPQGFDPRREKEKDKRGLFKWGGGEKKGKKDQREKEKDAGFFGSLFSSKRRQEEIPSTGLGQGQSGREAAVALLGESRSSPRGYVPPASPQPQSVNNYSRYPIHVERAIYRLSHIKLANPRRALYEQVLISNLMFWYLGVINKSQQSQSQTQSQSQQQAPRQEPTVQAPAVTGSSGPTSQKVHEEEREGQAWTGIEQAEKERELELKLATQGQGHMQAQPPGQVQQLLQPHGRRVSLTKGAPSNASPRRAEQPVRGPQYDMQHRAMEQEYGAFGGARPAGAGYAVPPGASGQTTPMQMSMSTLGPGPAASSPHIHNVGTVANPTAALPPGLATSPSRHSRSPPPPAGAAIRYVPLPPPVPVPIPIPIPESPSTPNSPSMPVRQQGFLDARPPMRSVSANAAQPLGPRGPGRKTFSAHAVPPPGAWRPRAVESVVAGDVEEDVPLALWQQQQQQHQSLTNQQPRRR